MKPLPTVEEHFAAWLAAGTWVGLGLLVLTFALYVTGMLEPHVPIERLPQLWSLSAEEFRRATGGHPGWQWITRLATGDGAILAPIALLASCSLASVAAVIPLLRARGERVLVAVCVVQILVIVGAAFA